MTAAHLAVSACMNVPKSLPKAVPGTEPIASEALRTIPPRENGGNLDIKQLSKGARLMLLVFVDGALFSVGDAHFAQGDGEACGTAIEMAGAIVVRFTVRPGAEADFDQLVARTAAGIRAHEPGTLVYAVHAVDGASRERIFYELYRDRAAFTDHEAQPHTRQFLAEREPLLESKQVDFLALTDGKLPVAPSALRTEASALTDEDVPGE